MRKLILLLMLASLAVPAAAVSTSHWTQSNAADFTDGKLHDVVVTNLGDVKLSREVKTLLDEDPKIGMVTALAQTPNGTIYAGTAPQGVLLQIAGGKVTTAATIDDAVSITALLAEPNGALLVGATGGKGRVLRIAAPGAKPQEIFSAKDVQYVWGLARSDDGTVYAATGPNGQLFAIHPDGK
jgi:DNA-binding beta-propeller fold protein YncE